MTEKNNTEKMNARRLNVVIWGFLSFFFMSVTNTSTLNLILNGVADAYTLDSSSLLYAVTVCGILGALSLLITRKLVAKFGNEKIIIISIVIIAFSYGLWGFSSSVILYAVCLFFTYAAANAFCNVGVPAMLFRFFPKRNQFWMGVVTLGVPAAGFLGLRLVNLTVGSMGIKAGLMIWGAILLIYAVYTFFVIGRGGSKDIAAEQTVASADSAQTQAKPAPSNNGWTIKAMLRSKGVIFIAITWGLSVLAIYALAAQALSIFMYKGLDQTTAVNIVSYAALFQFIGSFVSGIIDQKIGSFKTSVIFLIAMVIGFIVLCSGTSLTVMVIGYYIIMFIGGAPNNLMATTTKSKVGAEGFTSVYTVVMMVITLIRSLGTTIFAFALTQSGDNYTVAAAVLGIAVVLSIVTLFIAGPKEEQPKV